MEQSYLNKIIATLKVAYPYFFKDMSEDEAIAFITLYTKKLSKYEPNIVITAIDKIITSSKFMPSIAEVLEKCDEEKSKNNQDIISKMIDDNYFKNQQEINKAVSWLDEGVIPQWFKKDMEKYGYNELNQQLLNNNFKK